MKANILLKYETFLIVERDFSYKVVEIENEKVTFKDCQ